MYNVLYNALNRPQAVPHLLTQELCVVEPSDVFEMLLLLRHCSYGEGTQQFHHFPYLSACFDLLNMLLVICLVLFAGLHGQVLSSIFGGGCSDNSRLEHCKRD